jgi:hypothetical protein
MKSGPSPQCETSIGLLRCSSGISDEEENLTTNCHRLDTIVSRHGPEEASRGVSPRNNTIRPYEAGKASSGHHIRCCSIRRLINLVLYELDYRSRIKHSASKSKTNQHRHIFSINLTIRNHACTIHHPDRSCNSWLCQRSGLSRKLAPGWT